MKYKAINTVLGILCMLGGVHKAEAATSTRLVMVAPFDNLSGRHDYISYEVDTGAITNNPRRQFHVDRYCHAPRELLEHIIADVPGLVTVERAQFDRVMLEASGSIRDGLVDPEKAQRLAIKLGADTIIMGSILDLKEQKVEYNGYVAVSETFYTAKIRVRVIDLVKERGSQKLVPAVPASFVATASFSNTTTPYLHIQLSDPYFSALSSAIESLPDDEEFFTKLTRTASLASESKSQASVSFVTTPKRASVFVREDGEAWRYLGLSPLKHRFLVGSQYGVRFEKEGFKTWESTIEAVDGFRVAQDLTEIRPADGQK